jgi:hypothetical protein
MPFLQVHGAEWDIERRDDLTAITLDIDAKPT